MTGLYELEGYPERASVLTALESIPDRLQAIVRDLPASRLIEPPGPGEWSAFRTCCHMRDAALVYAARFRWIVFDDAPFLSNYDEDNWVAASRDTADDLPAILEEIAASRSGLMRVLTRLSEDAWTRIGQHEVIGAVELDPYVRHQLAHELSHLAQVESALGRAP